MLVLLKYYNNVAYIVYPDLVVYTTRTAAPLMTRMARQRLKMTRLSSIHTGQRCVIIRN